MYHIKDNGGGKLFTPNSQAAKNVPNFRDGSKEKAKVFGDEGPWFPASRLSPETGFAV